MEATGWPRKVPVAADEVTALDSPVAAASAAASEGCTTVAVTVIEPAEMLSVTSEASTVLPAAAATAAA